MEPNIIITILLWAFVIGGWSILWYVNSKLATFITACLAVAVIIVVPNFIIGYLYGLWLIWFIGTLLWREHKTEKIIKSTVKEVLAEELKKNKK